MLPELLSPLLAVFTSLGLGAMGLVGIRMWVNKKSGPDPTELADLISRQLREDIRDEVARAFESREAEMEELHERLDFAERLLSQTRSPRALGQHKNTPV